MPGLGPTRPDPAALPSGAAGGSGLGGRRRVALMRAAAGAAVAATLLMWVQFVGVGLATPRFNLLTRAASDLGAVGAPGGAIFDAGFFVVPGLLTMLFAAGLLAAAPGAMWRAGALLVAAEGALLVLAGLFPENPGSASLTATHQLLATLCFGSAALAPLLLLLGMPGAPGRWGWDALTVSSVAVLVVEVAGVVTSRLTPYPDGLFQRPFGVALTAWFLASAVWLWHRAGQPSQPGSRAPRAKMVAEVPARAAGRRSQEESAP